MEGKGMATATVRERQARRALPEWAMVAAKFPERKGAIRRIHRLWNGAYRVNFHEADGNHFVTESWFVTVDGGSVCGERG
jgi:hypothetical protein